MKACKNCNNNTFVIDDDGTIACSYCHSILLIEKEEPSKELKSKSKTNKAVEG